MPGGRQTFAACILPHTPPPHRKEDARLLEKRQPENIQIIEKKKKKTLTISKQINKAMTKQYIYIYRYKKERKCAMIPVSSLHKNVHISIII